MVRYSSLVALGAITEGCEKQHFLTTLNSGFNLVLNKFNDQSIKVREATGWVFSRISETHCEIFSDPTVFQNFLMIIGQKINDRPKVSGHICKIIELMTEFFTSDQNKNPSEANLFTPYLEQLFNTLYVNALRQDFEGSNADLTLASFAAISSLFQNAGTSSLPYIVSILPNVLQEIKKFYSPEYSHFSDQRRKDLIDYCLGLVQIIVARTGDMIPDELASLVLETITFVFQTEQKITENGLIAFSGLCHGIGSRLNIQTFNFNNYLLWALQNFHDKDVVRLACMNISDISLALGKGVQIYLREFFPYISTILKNTQYDKDSKLQAISTMGDLAMHGQDLFIESYLSDALQILYDQLPVSTSVEPHNEDREAYTHSLKLRQTIVDAYVNILIGVAESQNQQGKRFFADQVQTLFNYLRYICKPAENPSKVSAHLKITILIATDPEYSRFDRRLTFLRNS